jgi:plasmid stabilization system protein ParE
MAKIVLSDEVIAKLLEIEAYYMERDENVAKRAVETVFSKLRKIADRPLTGRPQLTFPELNSPELREAVIPFGDSGFLALYRIDRAEDSIVILALKHQREEGFGKVEF